MITSNFEEIVNNNLKLKANWEKYKGKIVTVIGDNNIPADLKVVGIDVRDNDLILAQEHGWSQSHTYADRDYIDPTIDDKRGLGDYVYASDYDSVKLKE